MIHPSYSELIKVVNDGVEEGEEPVVTSRYSIVLATSRRARQIIGSSNSDEITQGKKPLSVAVDELYKGKIRILSEEEAEQFFLHIQECGLKIQHHQNKFLQNHLICKRFFQSLLFWDE